MKTTTLLLTVAVLVPLESAVAQQRSFYDKSGSYAGSSSTYNAGKSTSFYDRNGSFAGSAVRNWNGTTSFYDKNGSFTASVVTTRR